MRPYLDPEAAVHGVAGITERTNHLSHTLFDIAHGIVDDSTVPQAIRNIAWKLADIAKICTDLCRLLDKDKLCTNKSDIGRILGRLDVLLKEFEMALLNSSFTENKKVPRWFKSIFQHENIADIVLKCQSIKEPLCLFSQVLQIADTRNTSNMASSKEKEKDHEMSLAREIDCAESRVETNRQVIKALMNAERRISKAFSNEELQLHYLNESPGATAGWLYDLIFNKALSAGQSPEQRLNARGGSVKTMRTDDGDDVAFDSDHEDPITPISSKLEEGLDVSKPRRLVINELLERLAGLNFREVRELVGTSGRGRTRLQDTSQQVIRWHLKNEKTSFGEHERSLHAPQVLDRGRVLKDNQDESARYRPLNFNNDAGSPPPRVRTPPATPIAHGDQHTTPPMNPNAENKRAGMQVKGNVDVSRASVLGAPHIPSVATGNPSGNTGTTSHAEHSLSKKLTSNSTTDAYYREVVPRENSANLPELEVSSEPNPDIKKGKKKKATVSDINHSAPLDTVVPPKEKAASVNDTVVPVLRKGEEFKSKGTHPFTIRFEDDAAAQSKKPSSAKQLTNERDHRRSHANVRSSSQPGSSRTDPDTTLVGRRRHTSMLPQENATSERRSRESIISLRESSSQRKEATSHKLMKGDEPIPHRNSLPPVETSANAYSTNTQYPHALSRNMAHPTGPLALNPGAYMNPPPSTHGPGYIGNYYDQGGALEREKNAKMTELQKRIDELEKGVKERRDAEETKRHDELLKAQKSEMENFKTSILAAQDSVRREAEKKLDETATKLQAVLNEQTRLQNQSQNQHTDMRIGYHKDDLHRFYEVIEKCQQREDAKAQEWEKEKENMDQFYTQKLDEYQEALDRQAEEHEEEQEKALEQNRKYYESIIKMEQEKFREAKAQAESKAQIEKARADNYLKMYTEECARTSSEQSATPVITNLSKGLPDDGVFKYLDKGSASIGLQQDHKNEPVDEKTGAEQIPNKYDDRYHPNMIQDRTKRHTASSVHTQSSDETNVIVFPPRAGWSDIGHNQLGNYLSISGFKAMFEEREHVNYDPTGRHERIGSGSNVLRGTLFWQPPASTAEADLYRSLRNSGWRPTYVRKTVSGQTWFFGAQPVHAQFFGDMYKPQVGAFRVTQANPGSEKESLIISKDLVETQELEFLGHIYEEIGQEIYLDPTLTSEDIDHIVARTFLAREGRLRRKFRNTQLRASQTKVDITEVASEVGDNESEVSFGNRERRVSLWSLWSPWSR